MRRKHAAAVFFKQKTDGEILFPTGFFIIREPTEAFLRKIKITLAICGNNKINCTVAGRRYAWVADRRPAYTGSTGFTELLKTAEDIASPTAVNFK